MLLLSVMALLVPEQGIGIGATRLFFFNFSDLRPEKVPSPVVDVERLLSLSMVTDDPESDPKVNLFLPSDNITVNTRLVIAPTNVDSLKNSIYRIVKVKF